MPSSTAYDSVRLLLAQRWHRHRDVKCLSSNSHSALTSIGRIGAAGLLTLATGRPKHETDHPLCCPCTVWWNRFHKIGSGILVRAAEGCAVRLSCHRSLPPFHRNSWLQPDSDVHQRVRNWIQPRRKRNSKTNDFVSLNQPKFAELLTGRYSAFGRDRYTRPPTQPGYLSGTGHQPG